MVSCDIEKPFSVVSVECHVQPWLVAMKPTVGALDALISHIPGCVGSANLPRLVNNTKHHLWDAISQKYSVPTRFISLGHSASEIDPLYRNILKNM